MALRIPHQQQQRSTTPKPAGVRHGANVEQLGTSPIKSSDLDTSRWSQSRERTGIRHVGDENPRLCCPNFTCFHFPFQRIGFVSWFEWDL